MIFILKYIFLMKHFSTSLLKQGIHIFLYNRKIIFSISTIEFFYSTPR